MNLHSVSIDNHAVFRVLLQAMSRPGEVLQLPGVAGIGDREAMERLLGCLLDPQVGFAVAGSGGDGLADRVRLATGGRQVPVAEADFILVPSGESGTALEQAKRGLPDYPDQGATVVYAVTGLSGTTGGAGPVLSGPGIRETVRPEIRGLGAGEIPLLRQLNSEFPLGIDAVFVDPRGRIMCIPRSTRIGGL